MNTQTTYPPLPKSEAMGNNVGVNIGAVTILPVRYTADQMRAYVDADRAKRAAPAVLEALEELIAEFGVCGLTERARAAVEQHYKLHDSPAAPSAPTAKDEPPSRAYGPLVVGRLPTVTQDKYPGLGPWWVQVWDGDNVLARAYGGTPQLASESAHRIASSLAAPTAPAAQSKNAKTCDKCSHYTPPEDFLREYEGGCNKGRCALLGDANDGTLAEDRAYGYDLESYQAGVYVGPKFGCIHWTNTKGTSMPAAPKEGEA